MILTNIIFRVILITFIFYQFECAMVFRKTSFKIQQFKD